MDTFLINDKHIINDKYIIDLCFQKNTSRLKRNFNINNLDDNVKKYLLNRYKDSLSINETLKRIYYHIDVHPKCPICDNLVKFGGTSKTIFFHQTCGNSKCLYQLQSKILSEKYGVKNVFQLNTTKEKIKNTLKQKYGVEHALQNKTIKKKQEKTCIDRFGESNIFKTEKFKLHYKNIMLNKYGVDHPMKSCEIKNKFNWKLMVQHQIETKRKNHSFNISKKEAKSYLLLKSVFNDINYQYKSNEYPFYCDFYIPSINTYIECNYHWTHGGHPYLETKQDLMKINEWKSKNSKYYNNAIITWTIRDVNKRNIAKENNLNYIEFWNIEELKCWLKLYSTNT